MQLTKKNILIIGFGIVGIPCAYAISRMNPRRFYIIDMKKEDDLNEKIPPNAKFYNFEVTKTVTNLYWKDLNWILLLIYPYTLILLI